MSIGQIRETEERRGADGREEVTLPVTGMTCASCVRRIERALGKVAGVQDASVNLATEKAKVVFDPAIAGLGQLKGAVEKAGYGVGAMPAEAVSPSASAHAVILSEDAGAFVHTHGEQVGVGATNHGAVAAHGTEGAVYGPKIAIHHTFPAPGLHKVWG